MQSLILTGTVGAGGVNAKRDVAAVQERLHYVDEICASPSGVCDRETVEAIKRFQQRFLAQPDGLINVQGMTLKLLDSWSIKPIAKGVDLRGNLRKAWDLVNPLLPAGSSCVSGYRSADDQRRILHNFFQGKFKAQIVAKYGAKEWQQVWDQRLEREARVLEMVRSTGQKIAAPGKSLHQQGKAIDVGGPEAIDPEQVKVIKMVAKANATLLSGVVLLERNGCVHFELR